MNVAVKNPEDFSDFDPFGTEFRADTVGFYPRLLKESPGFIVMEGVPSIYLAKHSDVVAALQDFKRFSSVKPTGLPGMERIDFFNGNPVMNYSDPPQHQRLRRLVSSAFSPKRVADMAGAAARIANELLDELAGRTEIEAVGELTKPLSIRLLLTDFMGLADPAEQRIFLDYISAIPLLDKMRPGDRKPQAFLDAWDAGAAYCKRAVARARDEHTESLIGLIAAANADEEKLSDNEMMALLMTLFSGGISTMGGSGTASLINLAREPSAAARIRRDPELAVSHYEESLRLDAPVTLVMRFVNEEMEIGGRAVTKGTPVYVLIGAAGYDPEVFPEPHRFNIDRENLKAHMAFGYGLHTCVGNNIARATIPVLIQIMAERFPNLRLAQPNSPFHFDTTPRSRHYAALPLAL